MRDIKGIIEADPVDKSVENREPLIPYELWYLHYNKRKRRKPKSADKNPIIKKRE